MLPLNPFLRAFFRSALPAQCSPAHYHILLVPSTEFLLTSRDRDSQVPYAELCSSEEFLASHVLRIPKADGKASLRESRGKAKQFTTINGRTTILKDSHLYTNKGFKHLTQAQITGDSIYYADTPELQPWIVYHISRALVGVPAAAVKAVKAVAESAAKKEISSFANLLIEFPTIASQMASGLERIFNEFKREADKPLPELPPPETAVRRFSISTSQDTLATYESNLELEPQEQDLRHALEVAITAAIDLFQMVDKQQLSSLGATTDLTGSMVEKMIEKYVTQHLHDSLIFPKLSGRRKKSDAELEARMRQMVDIDISQVGLSIETGRAGKRELSARLTSGVDKFKRMGVASSPQEMLDILVETEKIITHRADETSEKRAVSISADTLVSLLLIVVIRAPVRHLQARLLYMRHFIFLDDVESGELGYALSTFEAVLSYLSHDSNGLRRSSLRNKRLWQATKAGDVAAMREVLEPGTDATPVTPDPPAPDRPRKKVSLQSRNASISSIASITSIMSALPHEDDFDGDLSIETLAQTQGPDGESVVMMAVRSEQVRALRYLLNLRSFFSLNIILEDEDNAGTTLLSAAIQSGNQAVADMILDFIVDLQERDHVLIDYIGRQDHNGRTAAHFLFEYPRLLTRISQFVPWDLKDKNGQTPLFALCRSYDHGEYRWMIQTAIAAATKAQHDRLRLADHVDAKGNTLLHILNEPTIATEMLRECNADLNAANDKQFTPLMVASKYGRTDMVRVLFGDPRVDIYARDYRGLTATELAKDDEVRNRIDDLVLLAAPALDRVTAVVRSYFVEDGSMRFIIKSAAKNPNSTITITTCRRALSDFEDLATWLALEHPASWLPKPTGFLPAVLLPSKPSRSIARDTQLRLDLFLKTLLSHSAFGTHEMVWEFFLVPDMDPSVLIDRSKQKAALRVEMVRDDFEPVSDVREVEMFVAYARDSIKSLAASNRALQRRTANLRLAQADLGDAAAYAGSQLASANLGIASHQQLLKAMAKCYKQTEHSPYTAFFYDIEAVSTTISALISSFKRPAELIAQIVGTRKKIDRAAASYRRATDRNAFSLRPIGLHILDDARARATREAAARMNKAVAEQQDLGRELRYTQQTVAQEMAAWQEERVRLGRAALKTLASGMLVVERERLEALKRAARSVGVGD